jgi:crotonobetainyl-CoA:carnitine CoA-transferase CaiB-like acyl-CoA transferase
MGEEQLAAEPLAGLRVLDLTRVLAGPLCTMLLGDMGADVVKVERPGGGDDTRSWGPPFAGTESAYFLGVNRNKRSLALDLGGERGRAVLRRLIVGSDVVIDNFKLGTMARWGFDDDWYEAEAPRVIRCTITGYGSDGPKAGMPGYDFILQAETGLMAITGEPDGESMKLGVAIVDICTGLMATISILAAVEARHTSGRGGSTEVSLHDTGLTMLANVAANYLISAEPASRYGNGHPNIVPYRTYRAADGELAVAVGNDTQFVRFAEVVGHPEWAEDGRFRTNADRVTNREAVDSLVGEVVAERTRAEWIEVLDGAGIPSGPINSVAEALSSPQTQARGMVTEAEHATAGLLRMLGMPIRFDDATAAVRYPPPLLGEHTDVVLRELGFDDAEIEELQAAGAI